MNQAWRLLIMDTPTNVPGDGRYWSRVVKILPHHFFRSTPVTIFADWKLKLNMDPRVLVNRTLVAHHASFVVWRHMCALAL